MTTSFLDTVMPARVANRNPRSLNASSTSATVDGPYVWTSASMSRTESFLRIDWLTNSYSDGSNSSPSASSSACSMRSL